MIMVMQIETVNWSIVMEIKKAEIKDLDVVVKMKMEMFIEVGSISLLQAVQCLDHEKQHRCL